MRGSEEREAVEGRKPMRETWYRASRWFRVLGNPTAYRVMKRLGPDRKTVTRLASEMGLGLNNMSYTLRQLRQVDLVRYETDGKNKVYWVKDSETLALMLRVEAAVDRMRARGW